MPKYELMYLLGSHIADTEVNGVTQQVLEFLKESGASEVKEEHLGKKKLAYPIKKTRNGYYVVVNFSMEGKALAAFDAKVRSQNQNIIRYILVNLEEHIKRSAKDKKIQTKLGLLNRKEKEAALATAPTPIAEKKEKPKVKLEEIDDQVLDKKIEEALSEDLTK